MKSCLKISFHGEVSFVICEAGSSYEQIIAQACARFHIPEAQRAGLVLTNGQGYVFEQQLLEYFLLLFPCPELLFYLRLDWQKLRRALIEPVKRRRSADDIREIQPDVPDGTDYVAVPVHRQNCFIGALPSSAPVAAAVSRQNCFLRAQLQEQQQQSASVVLHRLRQEQARPESQPKRMRLQLYKKSRRSLPSAGPHSALLATATRSIRI
ncbi:uncharacterized protein Corp [Drosophila montana]|uniref:uncharacterized protein Corp n=1 Tax=Drosophila montana TaxID=40370 RepID=UPI00313E0EBA